jgi:phosphatidylglycerol:prolipoprotein diacylglycerol transferase
VFPELFEIPKLFTIPAIGGVGPIPFGPFTVYTYGVLLALSYLLGLRLAMWRGKRWGLNPSQVLDLGIYIIIAALVGAKLLLLIVERDSYLHSPEELWSLMRAGGVFYGGLLLAVAVAFWYIAKHKMPFWRTCDVFAPAIALGHVTGRMGCLAAGCCFGKPTDVAWAITFKNPLAANVGTPLNTPLHPTQLYEAGAEALILGILLYVERRGRAFEGRTFWLYMLLYAISRFIIEFFRGDPRGVVLGVSTSQFISLVLAPLAIIMLIYLAKATPPMPQASGRRSRAVA